MPIEPVDLLHLGNERVIGVYVVDTPEGPALFDCGPATCFERLEAAVDLSEIRHLLLSHIHLDHAGAAGHVVRAHPQIRVHVSEVGAPHVLDPTRLFDSARRLYGDGLDELYGEPLPVPQENVEVIWDTAAGIKSFPTPGHASHHVCYLLDDGTLLAGDAVGVRILPGRHAPPHAPPPDIDLDAWERTFDEILRHQPERLALIHFGVVSGTEAVAEHIERTRLYLGVWAKARIRRDDRGRVRRSRTSGHRGERGRRRGPVFSGGSPRPVVPRAGALLAQEEESRMPKPPLPPEVDALLRKANPAVIATSAPDGSPHTAATWYDWDGERLLVNMDAIAPASEEHAPRPARFSHGDARPGLVPAGDVFGRAVEIRDDPEFKDIDRLCLRYTRRQFQTGCARGSALIEPDPGTAGRRDRG